MDKEILLQGLEERYSSIRIIRERVYNITIWSLGVLLALGWGIVQMDKSYTCCQKTFFIVILFSAGIVLYDFYLKDLESGFYKQREIAAKLEKELWFFIKTKDRGPLYPEEWITPQKGHFFRNSYIVIGFWMFVVMLTILFFM